MKKELVMKNTVQTSRDNNMGTLHLVAALFVMYGHHCDLLNIVEPTLLGCTMKAIGVKIIFLISGYLITKSLWNIKGNKKKVFLVYSMKRIGRIYPELFGCVTISALIIGPIFTSLGWSEYWQKKDAIVQYVTYNLGMYPIFWLPGVFENNPYPNAVNGSLWTMPVEVFLYLLIFVIYFVGKDDRTRKRIYTGVTMVLIVIFFLRIYFFFDTSVVIYGTDWLQALNLMPYFLIGGMAWLFEWEKHINLQVSACLFLATVGSGSINTPIINELICMVVLSNFVLSLMLTTEQKLKLHFVKGEYAYGMYLYGFVVQQCMICIVFGKRNLTVVNFYITYIVCVISTYFIGMLSYKYIYKPVNKVIGKCLSKYNQAKLTT